jgi:hypothetical protein
MVGHIHGMMTDTGNRDIQRTIPIWIHDIRKITTRIWDHDIREKITDKEISGQTTELLLTMVHNQVASISPDSGYRMKESTIRTGIADLQGKTIHCRILEESMSESSILSSVVVDGKARAAIMWTRKSLSSGTEPSNMN